MGDSEERMCSSVERELFKQYNTTYTTGNMRNVTLRGVRATTLVVEKQ